MSSRRNSLYLFRNLYILLCILSTMVLQYKLKTETKWKKYPGKSKLKYSVSKYDFRLLNEAKTRVPTGDFKKMDMRNLKFKENTFEEVEICEWYQIFENKDKTKKTAIYFRENTNKFEELIKKVKNEKTVLYVFSYGV